MCSVFNKSMLEIMYYYLYMYFYSVGIGCSLPGVYVSSVPKIDVRTVRTSIFD